MSAIREQKLVDEHFARVAPQWRDVYLQGDVFAVIHQQRRDVALGFIERQHLNRGSRVLDIGCGAGVLSIELARRGYLVNSLDSVPEMVQLTRHHADEAGVSDCVTVETGDAHRLAFQSGTFDSIVALGVTPFLHSLPEALDEMCRVLRPGGLIVINSDNAWRLTRVLDPLLTPLLVWIKRPIKRCLKLLRTRSAEEPQLLHMYSNREFVRLLGDGGFQALETRAVGYGPFTLFERKILSDKLGVRVNRLLQSWSERRISVLQTVGSQYIVLARKCTSSEFQA